MIRTQKAARSAVRTGRASVAAGLLALAAACTGDGGPTTITPPPEPPNNPSLALYGTYDIAALIECNVTMATLDVACGSPQAPAGVNPPPIGGKGMHTRLIATGAAYDAGTQVFSVDTKVRNLLVQTIGTADGSTITGVTPFFVQLPTRTGGSGSVSLLNPDGTATFTAANQRYYTYATKLMMDSVTAPRSWQFGVAPTVTTFRFRVYVSAETLPVIVFDKEDAGNRDIYRVALDGTDLVRLTTAAAADIDPVSAQGWVVFSSYRRFNADLYSTPLKGGVSQTRISSTAANHLYPTINKNATAIMYTSDETGASKLWSSLFFAATGEINNNGARTLFPHTLASLEASPDFTPGTSKFGVFVSTLGTSPDIYSVTLGGVPVPLITSPGADVEPAYNRQGTQIAFTSNRDGDDEIYVYTIAGGGTVRLTNHPGYDGQPTWLQDGRIVYVTDTGGGARQLVWINPTTMATGVIPTGTGVPRNPSGVPLY